MDRRVKPVADLPPLPHIAHQTSVTEDGQMMGSFRLIDFKVGYQLRNCFWLLHQTTQNPQPRCIAHGLQDFRAVGGIYERTHMRYNSFTALKVPHELSE